MKKQKTYTKKHFSGFFSVSFMRFYSVSAFLGAIFLAAIEKDAIFATVKQSSRFQARASNQTPKLPTGI